MTGTGRVCGTSASSAPRVTTAWRRRAAGRARAARRRRTASACVGSMPRTSTTSRPSPAAARQQDPGRRPGDPARAVVVEHDVGPVDLEVVVVLGVERARSARRPRPSQVLDRGRRRLAGVVPALEGRDHDRVAQLGHVLELDHPCLHESVGSVPAATASRPGRPAYGPCPAAIHAADDSRPIPPTRRSMTLSSRSDLFRTHARRARPRRRRRDGHDAPGRRPHPGRLRGPRGLQRDPQRHPPRRRPRGPRRLLRGRRRPRRDQHLRRQPRQPRRVRHRRPHLRAGRGRRPARPRGRRRLVDRRTGRAGCSARSARAPSCRRSATRRTRRCATPTSSRSPGLVAGGADAVLVETAQDLLQAKAAVIGAQRALARAGADAAGLRPGHRRDHRHDAARHRDRRRADRARAARHRRDRPQLRHRPGRDERAPAPPRPGTPGSPVSCMPNAGLPRARPATARTTR